MAAAPDEDDVSSLLELFSGRFESSDMEVLLSRHGNDKREVANYLLTTEPEEVRKTLSENRSSWNLVTNLKRLKQQHHQFDRAKKGVIHTSVREFSCIQCDTFWWRRVPKRKMVSTCKRCHQRYRAIPRKREWGVAEYTCANCYNNFRGWGQMELVWSPCYKCGTPCKPKVIIPPSELDGPRKRNKHQCMAPDCHNRYQGNIWYPPGMDQNIIRITCVHPKSRRLNGLPVVVESSDDHISTGSTVATFLDQGNLKEVYAEVVFSPPLPPIDED